MKKIENTNVPKVKNHVNLFASRIIDLLNLISPFGNKDNG